MMAEEADVSAAVVGMSPWMNKDEYNFLWGQSICFITTS